MRPRRQRENPAFNTRISMGVSQSGSRAGDEFEPAATDRNRAAVGSGRARGGARIGGAPARESKNVCRRVIGRTRMRSSV
jgi:hypothetical protein